MKLKQKIAALFTIFAVTALLVSSLGAQAAQPTQDWKAKADAARDKWGSLPAQQKAEVYALMEQKNAADLKVMEKYRDLGIIDDTVLNHYKEKAAEKAAAVRNSGELPLFAEKMRPADLPKKK